MSCTGDLISVATPSFLECGFYHSLCSRCWAALWRRALSGWVFIPPASGSVGSWVLLRNGPQPESCLIQGHACSLEVGCVHVKGVKACRPDARGDNSRAPGAGWGRPLSWLHHHTFHGEGTWFPSAESYSLPFPTGVHLELPLNYPLPPKPSRMQILVCRDLGSQPKNTCLAVITWDHWYKCLVECLKNSRSSVNVAFILLALKLYKIYSYKISRKFSVFGEHIDYTVMIGAQ